MEKLWSEGRHVLDHWRALQTIKLTRHFSLWTDPELQKLQPGYRLRAYKNSKCRGRRKKCATLFATYNGVDTGILQSQIESLGLFVDIVWLGDQLSNYVHQKVKAGKAIMFFNWHPNVLVATGLFTRINFPETHAQHKDAPVDCDFPVNQLTKVLWGPIKSGAPDAYHIISKMSFTDLEYDQLLAMASSSSFSSNSHSSHVPLTNPHLRSSLPSSARRSITRNLEDVACKWIQDNPSRWERWLPQSLKEKPKIYLGGLFPLTGKSWAEMGLVKAAELALDMVNEDPDILPSYRLEMIVNDTQCKHDTAMGQFIAFQRRQPPITGILGPGCSEAAERIASLSQHFHLLMVSYGAQKLDMSDRSKYPYFFNIGPPAHLYKQVYPALFEKLGWQVIGAVTQSSPQLPEYHLPLVDKHDLTSGGRFQPLVLRHKVLNISETADVSKTLKEFKEQKVRVIIADVSSNVARQIMCEAFKQQMTGSKGYVWFLPSWYPEDWQNVDYYNSEPSLQEIANSPHFVRENVPCTTEQVEQAYEGHFVLTQNTLAASETVVAGGITVKKFQNMYAKRCSEANVHESLFASFVYDAIWVFANALDVELQQNKAALETLGTQANARALQRVMGNLSFSGVSGWIRFQGENSNRFLDLTIKQVFTNETRLVGQYKPIVAVGKGHSHPLLQLDTERIRWLSPVGAILDELNAEDGECFLESIKDLLGVSCTLASVIILALVFFSVLVIAVILLFSLKYRCDTKVKKLKATHERMKELGLLSEEYSHLLTVDDWEISLDNIVLNRELGEGAFGEKHY
ncbi:guanylate cyclase [Elysia marginata]|uniref:Guanylate cyclase n=1 Tax=Elysia marginata TaxID=1093978 RepID=A0AAV4IZZ6_9GAST|nr:guanylate cyclase [Elysia marginata]